MHQYEKKIYSQNGEDGLIEEVFKRIGVINKFFVEFGVQNGRECNTRLLRERGWNGISMDRDYSGKYIHKVFITVENINNIFASFRVPKEFDLLSIDVDGNDFWLWQALMNYNPKCVIIEYNSQLPPNEILTIPYRSDFKWNKMPARDDFFGASLGAMIELGKKKGYSYICVNEVINHKYVNAFFVKSEYICKFDKIDIPMVTYDRYYHDENKYKRLIDPFKLQDIGAAKIIK